MAQSARPVIAAFDFDGTLSYRDTLPAFLYFCAGKKALGKIFLETPSLLLYSLGFLSRQKAKERALSRFFKGIEGDRLRKWGAAFAQGPLNRLIKPQALARLRWHQAQGHRCILISASLEIYLKPWRQSMGFHDLICSELDISPQGIATGLLKGKNCWGEEKTKRLADLLGPREGYTLYAYGDSRGDRELLALADYPFYRRMS